MTTLFTPSRCTASLPDDLTRPYLVGEEKLDGSRYVLYLGYDPYDRRKGNCLLSRRVSTVDLKHVDRTDQIPHITHKEYLGLEGTVLDGEIFLTGTDFKTTSSIISSSPVLAVQKQKDQGLLTYHVFDVMSFRGKDVRTLPLEQRRKILEEVVKRMNNPNVIAIEQFTSDFDSHFKRFVSKGGEGIIVKDSRQAYGMGWSKYKKSFDLTCVISGYKEGNGKYAGGVGSLALSVFHEGALVEVGFASGFDDKLRSEMTANFQKFLGMAVDIFAQEISKPSKDHTLGRLRHPTFHRLREDFTPSEATFSKLMDDIKAQKAMNRRIKKDGDV